MGTLALLGHLFGGFVEPGLQVQADRCLRASGSGCRECVDICPAGALRLGPSGSTEAPQSMLSQCTDCGLCAAACPSGAITGVGVSAGALTRGAERQSAAMRVVCAPARRERPSSEQGQSFSVSCLAALHPETVVATALALEPNSTLTLTRAQCSACPIAQQAQVQTVVQESVSLLQRLDDGGRQIVFESTSPDATDSQQRVTAQPNAAQHSAAGRRCWSRRELLTAGRSGGRAAPAPAVTSARGELLSHSADPSSVPMHLTHPIDARGCTFCHACAAVCPTEALQIGRLPADDSEPGDGPVRLALAVDPARCVGCGRCAQVCVENLLTLGCVPETAAPDQGRVRRMVVIARGERSNCQTCQQPLGPGEQGVCRGCASARTLVADVLAR